ncbi:MAG: SEL1-like repeat protein, partial [Verrucomicrobia bacterium]|nr:SEL1-like repeat protein [Verrucomicrobiota bacterium]
PPARPQTNTVDAEILKKQTDQKAETLKRTIEFQKKRAEQGSAVAQFDLGKRYLTGDGLEKNLQEARKWFEAAAKQGHAGAAARIEEVGKLEAAATKKAEPSP